MPLIAFRGGFGCRGEAKKFWAAQGLESALVRVHWMSLAL